MRSTWWVPALATLVTVATLMAGCSEDGVTGAASDDATAADTAAPGDAGGIARTDVPRRTPPDAGGAKPDAGPERPRLPGTGEPCTVNEDCESGWCLNGATESVCTETCLETCPDGWVCKSVLNRPPDVVYLCVPTRWDLCKACASDAECGGTADLCRPVGDEGPHCSVACTGDASCPQGYACLDTDGGKQCLPEGGSCACLGDALGRTEACSRTNDLGTCFGTRTCAGPGGWTACDAAEPAAETCNGSDDDCDGAADEGLTGAPCERTNDAGTCAGTEVCAGADGWTCDAAEPAPEACNGADDDCDGEVDEGFDDANGNGLADCLEDDTDGDGDPNLTDCAPTDPAIHHGAPEVCNGVDDDCGGVIDDPGAGGCTAWLEDADGDGFGGDASSCLCAATSPWTALVGGDCDDANAFAHPGATEDCGGGDEDCDGELDEPGATGCVDLYADGDGDGFGAGDPSCLCAKEAPFTALQAGDCNDEDPGVKPTTKEACNGVDDDCDGQVDEPGAQGCAPRFLDEDGDGFGVTGAASCVCGSDGAYTALVGGDCDDANEAIHPDAAEACNGADDDCDGAIDGAGAEGCATWYQDADGDDFGVTTSAACLCAPAGAWTAEQPGDCDDARPDVHPGATETCALGDEDCDGVDGEPGAAGCADWYPDGDGDGYGPDGAAVCLCAPSLGLSVAQAGDCDDADPAKSPGATEACGGGDEDCDGSVDEPGAQGCTVFWADEDADGFGAIGQSVCLCGPQVPWVAGVGGDCDDGDPAVAPGVVELCADAADCCDATACVYGVCITPPGTCVDGDDCPDDTTCDGGLCVPWGLGPLPQADEGCAKPTVVGQFRPSLQCEWAGPPAGDPYPDNITVIATPTVVDFDLDDDPSTVQPSIVQPVGVEGCDQPNSYGAGVIRVLDGRTCEQLATIGEPKVVAAAAVALGDLTGDGRPEIVALREGGGLVAFTWDAGAQTWGLLWTSVLKTGAPDTVPTTGVRYGGPTLADVDGDGTPEILQGAILYDADGKVLADNLGLKNPANGPLAVVADVDGDGQRELVAGDGVWQYAPASGAWVKEVWSGGGADGFVALADFGPYAVGALPEPLPEVVVVSSGILRIQTLSGQVVFGPYDLPFFPPSPSKGFGGAPTVGDFDGDGSPEVALAGRGSYSVFDPGCVGTPAPFGCWADGILWSVPSQDYSSSVTGSSVFDFEADGLAEAVYADECFVRVYSGLTGEILFSQARTSGTWYENPIVADVDGDFRSEIVVGSNTSCSITCPAVDPYFRGLRCQTTTDCAPGAFCKVGYCRCGDDAACGDGSGFSCQPPLPNTPGTGNVCRAAHPGKYNALRVFSDVGDNWATSRTVWNQHVYFVTNVNEDGTIPAAGSNEENWKVPGLNNFRQNVQGDLDPTAAPDLTAGPLLLGNCAADGMLPVSAAICNRGAAPVDAGVPVAFFDGAPEGGGTIVCLLETGTVLFPGDCDTVTCTFAPKPPSAPHDVHVLADFGGPTGQSKECREGNNRAILEGVTCLNLP